MQGYKNYARTNIQTSDPRAVIVLLYEGAARFLGQAKGALVEREDRMGMSEYIQKTQKIIEFMTNSLDFEAGGEIAYNLDRLYAYMRDTLNEANIKCDPDKIQEVIDLLAPLTDAWKDVARDPDAAAALQARENAQASAPAVTYAAPDPVPAMAAVPQDPDAIDNVRISAVPCESSPIAVATASPKPYYAAAGRAAYGLR